MLIALVCADRDTHVAVASYFKGERHQVQTFQSLRELSRCRDFIPDRVVAVDLGIVLPWVAAKWGDAFVHLQFEEEYGGPSWPSIDAEWRHETGQMSDDEYWYGIVPDDE